MASPVHFVFGPFRLDPEKKRLWRGEEKLRLRPMAVAVLHVLAEYAGQILSKEDLLKRVWAETRVTKTVLKVCIREIREALGDDAVTPCYIETVGRQGYRFVGQSAMGNTARAAEGDASGGEPIVGREREIAQLQQWLAKARRGARQCVFVTGEPGLGKTTVVDLFLTAVRSSSQVRIGHGHCLEQYGEGEAYLPVLEAFGRLCREPGGARLIAVLKQYAPTWLVQMPALLGDVELASLEQRVQGTTRQRMLREMAEAVEALTVESPFVLVLEDLQWSDYSTLELISYLAQRQEPTRLLVIGTYRLTDIGSGHPLKGITQELRARRRCEELPLKLLTEKDVTTYLARRFPENTAPLELAHLIHQRTDGNALFMVNVVNALASQRLMIERNGRSRLKVVVKELQVPDTLRQLIEHRFERLSPEERQVLEAASVAGVEFPAAALAAAVGSEGETVQIEEVCADLARRKQFILGRGTSEWPDGIVSTRYGFIHALYQEVLYDRVTVGKRSQLHQRIGKRLEQGYSERAQEIAAELAMHFEQGRDYRRAIQYFERAAENANQRCAHREVVHHLTKALELMKALPSTAERTHQELILQISLGVSLTATKGYAAPESKKAYDRARELCQLAGEMPQLVPILRGLSAFYYARAELETACKVGEQILSVAQRRYDEDLLLEAYQEMGGTLFSMGEFGAALNYLEQSFTLYDPGKHRSHTALYGKDPGVSCLSHEASTLWCLGYPDQAFTRNQEALTMAEEMSHPYGLTYALNFASMLHQLRREGQAAEDRAETAIALSTQQHFPLWEAGATMLRGWALAEQGQPEEGMIQIHKGLALWQAIGIEVGRPYWLALMAESYGWARQFDKGLNILDEAIAAALKSGERWWEAELYRLKGQLTLQSQASLRQVKTSLKKSKITNISHPIPSTQAEVQAEACFQQALDVARCQQAKSLELRAAMSLARLWRQQGKLTEARQLVIEIYSWFTEGFATKDLQDAQTLLQELQVDAIIGEQSPTQSKQEQPRKQSVAH